MFVEADRAFIQEVISGSCEILQTATEMSIDGSLRYLPVRQSLCVISASVFLLKAVNISGKTIDTEGPLNILGRCMTAFHSNPVDDMDFSWRFASLMEKRVAMFRESLKSTHGSGRISSADRITRNSAVNSHVFKQSSHAASPAEITLQNRPTTLPGSTAEDDLWTRPFDTSFDYFSTSGNIVPSGLELDSLDFFWNITDV